MFTYIAALMRNKNTPIPKWIVLVKSITCYTTPVFKQSIILLIGTTKAAVFFGYLIGIFLPLYIKRKFSTSKNSVDLVFVQWVLSNQVLNAMNVNFNL